MLCLQILLQCLLVQRVLAADLELCLFPFKPDIARCQRCNDIFLEKPQYIFLDEQDHLLAPICEGCLGPARMLHKMDGAVHVLPEALAIKFYTLVAQSFRMVCQEALRHFLDRYFTYAPTQWCLCWLSMLLKGGKSGPTKHLSG